MNKLESFIHNINNKGLLEKMLESLNALLDENNYEEITGEDETENRINRIKSCATAAATALALAATAWVPLLRRAAGWRSAPATAPARAAGPAHTITTMSHTASARA